MRIGSPVGGRVSLAGSPSNDLIMKVTSMPNDVEAAIAMVGLSGGYVSDGSSSVIVHKSPTSVRAIGFDSVKVEPTDFEDVSKNCESLSRSVHIKCPVMPERHSFVQKALKRKIENRMEPIPANGADLQRPAADDHDEFVMAKRIRQETEVEQRQHHVGRFVRTCQPCRPDDVLRSQQRQIEPRQQPFVRPVDTTRQYQCHIDSSPPCPRDSFQLAEIERNVGRFVRTGQPCHSGDVWKSVQPALMHEDVKVNESGSPVSMPVVKNTGTERAPLLHSPDSKYVDNRRFHLNAQELPKSSTAIGGPARQSNGWLSQLPKTFQGSKIQPFSKQRADFSRIPSGSPSGGTMSSSIVKEHIPLNHSIVRNDTSQLAQTEHAFRHKGMNAVNFNQQVRKSDNLNALYSLGRYAASVCMPSLRRQELAHISDSTNSSIESQKLYSPFKQRLCSVFSQDVHFQNGRTNENAAVRIVRVKSLDVRTERKVANGEFGSLHSLQMFYNKLDKKPTGLESTRPRQALSSITNRVSVKYEEEYDEDWKCSNDAEETALDLSMRSNRASLDLDVSSRSGPRSGPGQIMRRKSRSCCSSPVSNNVTMLKRGTRETSTEYIDRLLLLESRSDLFQPDQAKNADNSTSLPSSPFASQKVEDDAQSQKSSPSKPNNMLPLKKRRLVEVDSAQKETPAVNNRSSASVVNGVHLKEENVDANHQISDVRSRLQCIASTVTQPDKEGDLPLHCAVGQRKFRIVSEVVKMMSQIGASLDVCNNLQQTALHLAVLTDQPDVVRLLLMAGASPNVVDHNGLTSVHHASKLPSASCLRCLVEHSTVPLDVNAVTYRGLSALHLAVKSGNPSTVTTLIEAGAFVDVRDRANGRTPLFYAVDQDDIQVATVLLEFGADPSMLNYSGCSPATAAASMRCSTEVARLLHAYATAGDRHLGSALPTVCLG